MTATSSSRSSSNIMNHNLVGSLVILAIAILVVQFPNYLERRDAKLNIEWPRDPIPDHGRMVTLQHSDADIQRYVIDEQPPNRNTKNLLIASQADIYYEAYFPPGCNKNFVILGGTNSQTFIYHDMLEKLHAMKFCTLTFDWRAHGRSEDTPGDMTTELFALDAAALIQHVFGSNNNNKVHVFGWSLGGFVGYQLALLFPDLVSSLVVYGSSACFAHIPDTSTECIDRWNFPKVFFSRRPVIRTLGLKMEWMLLGIVAKLQQPFSHRSQQFEYTQRMDSKVKTPPIWLQIQGSKTFNALQNISCPFQQMMGEHEHLATGTTLHSMELEAAKIPNAEPPIVLLGDGDETNGQGGGGYSHMALFEEGGLELIMKHLKVFYGKHA